MRSPQFALLLIIHASTPAHAESSPDERSRGHIGIEFGPAWFSRNDARIPGTTGTEFDMTDVTGSGPDAYFRIEGDWDINDKHGLRFVLAPLEVSGGRHPRSGHRFLRARHSRRARPKNVQV